MGKGELQNSGSGWKEGQDTLCGLEQRGRQLSRHATDGGMQASGHHTQLVRLVGSLAEHIPGKNHLQSRPKDQHDPFLLNDKLSEFTNFSNEQSQTCLSFTMERSKSTQPIAL